MEQKVPDTIAEPVIYLRNWVVIHFIDVGRIIFGTTPNGFGRRSTTVVKEEGGYVITSSGRKYKLQGPPGLVNSGQSMLSRFTQLKQKDISHKYLTFAEDCGIVSSQSEKVIKETMEDQAPALKRLSDK